MGDTGYTKRLNCILRAVVTSPIPSRPSPPSQSSSFPSSLSLPDIDQVVVQTAQAHQALAPRTRQLNSTLRALLRYADRSGEWRPSDEVPLEEDPT